jgi:transcriptional regulator with XRE-family HTH domain
MGETIKSLRNNRGLSIRELAETAGMKQSRLQAIEAGARIRDTDPMTSIAKALETDVSTMQSISEMSQIIKITTEPEED